MRQQIFNLLNGHLTYSETEISRFANFGQLRFDSAKEQLRNEISLLVNNEDNLLKKLLITREELPAINKGLFKLNRVGLIDELKRLDFKCLQSFLTNDINPEMKKYLTAFAEETAHPTLFSPSSNLTSAEFRMFQYIMKQPFEEEHEKLCNIANHTIRIILQEWLLYPELVSDKDEAKTIMEAIDCSNINLN